MFHDGGFEVFPVLLRWNMDISIDEELGYFIGCLLPFLVGVFVKEFTGCVLGVRKTTEGFITFNGDLIGCAQCVIDDGVEDRKSTRLNSSHVAISYALFCRKRTIENQI